MYRLTKENQVTSGCNNQNKQKNQIKNNIYLKGKEIIRNTKVIKRMETNDDSNCFVTLKDHKNNFFLLLGLLYCVQNTKANFYFVTIIKRIEK